MEIIIIALLVTLCVLAVIILAACVKNLGGVRLSKELERLRVIFDSNFARVDSVTRDEFARNRDESGKASRENREELAKSFTYLSETVRHAISGLSETQKTQFEIFSNQLKELTAMLDGKSDSQRELFAAISKEMREEQGKSLKSFEDSFTQNVKLFNDRQREQYDDMNKLQESIRQKIEEQLKAIREENSKKLEEVRKTVDENLKDTVEKRFNDSFKLISERLEKVHQGLGEMQQLASGVGDLKRVLTNVKTKGTLGEIQLGSILEQILSPGQYEPQAAIRPDSRECVDYVVKLPDKNSEDKMLLLPIDSKFPTEDYIRLLDAYDAAASDDEMKRISNAFESAVKRCAKGIHDKYINPPVTTDFAIMFVPTEALYAEVVRRPELFENIQRVFKVTVVGPTNLAAFLNSLQMGFRTLAIERRTNEVWGLLGAVKTEFGKFGGVMDKLKKKLDSAVKEVDTIGVRSRVIERTLRTVEELPAERSALLLSDTLETTEIPSPSTEDDAD